MTVSWFALFFFGVVLLAAANVPTIDSQELSLNRIKDVDKFIENMPKVELHLHLDGAMNPFTLWDLAQEKGVAMPESVKSAEDLKKFLNMQDNGNLPEFLRKFDYMLPQITGDTNAIERVAKDLVKTKAAEGVVYFETRYAPAFLVNDKDGVEKLTLEQVVNAVNKGLKEGSAEFGVVAKSILCCMRVPGHSKYSLALAKLAEHYKPEGVVGIDLAGDESKVNQTHPDDPKHVEAFKYAFEHGVHRTVHAGEAGPAFNVKTAIEDLHAERIGHGYRVLEDRVVYQMLRDKNVHLEECPYSSVKTGAFNAGQKGWKAHPIRRFFEDGASFSINTDDPTVTGHNLVDDYKIVAADPDGVQLPLQALVDSVRNGIDKAFVGEDEKSELREKIEAKLLQAQIIANDGY